MNSIALISHYNNIYLEYIFQTLIKKGITLSYFIIWDCNKYDLANTICSIDNNFSLEDIKKIEFNPLNLGFKKICQENSVPYFCVDNQNSVTISRILNQYPIDVLFITDRSIQRDSIYIPRLFAIDCHVASLSSYMEDIVTYTSEVSLRIVQPDSNLGPILGKKKYNINQSNSVDKETQIVCIDLAAEVLSNIQNNKIPSLQY